ncbi:MAG: glycosyltransferase family 9 protein [Ignavibacteriota bacterium]
MPQSILIIRLSSLGDIILTTPLIQELRRRYPDARIDFVVKKEYVEIAKLFSWLSNIYSLDTVKGTEEIQRLNREFKNAGYDHILDLHNNFRSRRLRSGLGGALHVVNKRTFKRWLLVKTKINLLKNDPDITGRYFETAHKLGIVDSGIGVTFGKDFSRSQITKAALCPGAKHWNKRWPAEYFHQTAMSLIANGFHIEFFGSSDENEYVNSIAAQLPPERVTNLCGKLTLAELPQRMAECSIAITNDSGLMHVATAAGIQTISIFGPTVRELGFYPRAKNSIVIENNDLDCRPCTTIGLDHCPKGHFRCMVEIQPGTIISLIP